MRRTPKIFHVLKFMALGAIFLTALGFGVRELWNCLIPDLFHGPVVSFWQALGLCLLGKLIFGWHGGGPAKWSRSKQEWRQKMQQRMEHMTPEEREKMRERLKRCMPMGRRWNQWNEGEETKETDPTTKPETNI
jgi:hypothetical protein